MTAPPTFVEALPPVSHFIDRHGLLRTILNQVFDESNVMSLPPTRRIELDFSGPEKDASKFTDKVRLVYEPRDLLSGDAWRSSHELDDNFRDELMDLTATEGVAYHYLLLADRVVKFQMKSTAPNTNGHIRFHQQKLTAGEPT